MASSLTLPWKMRRRMDGIPGARERASCGRELRGGNRVNSALPNGSRHAIGRSCRALPLSPVPLLLFDYTSLLLPGSLYRWHYTHLPTAASGLAARATVEQRLTGQARASHPPSPLPDAGPIRISDTRFTVPRLRTARLMHLLHMHANRTGSSHF